MSLTLAPVNDSLCKACTAEGWFMHSEQNRLLGFGAGAEGVVKFMVEYFEAALERDKKDSDFELVGVYDDDEPVGFFGLEDLGPNRRTIQVFQFMKPDANGLSETALGDLFERFFSPRKTDVVRMESEVLQINRPQVAVFREAGMIQEGQKRAAFWLGHEHFDILGFGITRNRWRKIKSGAWQKKRGPR